MLMRRDQGSSHPRQVRSRHCDRLADDPEIERGGSAVPDARGEARAVMPTAREQALRETAGKFVQNDHGTDKAALAQPVAVP